MTLQDVNVNEQNKFSGKEHVLESRKEQSILEKEQELPQFQSHTLSQYRHGHVFPTA